jgi:histidine phosphotransferase ChpT
MQHGSLDEGGQRAAAGTAGLAAMDLATTLCARVCHDLAGAAGALAGTLDLAAEDGDPEALALALCCANDLSARLRLLRAVWGRDGALPDLAALASGLPGGEKLQVSCAALSPRLDDAWQRLAAMLLIAGAAALPRGGRIAVSGGVEAGLVVAVEGPAMAWPAGLLRCLAGEEGVAAAALSPRDVGFALACLHARSLGLALRHIAPDRLAAS